MFDKDVSKYYDLVMADFDYQELVDYLDDLIIEAGGERTNILDIACGTAQELVFFLQLGYKVNGLDLSKNMIEVAKEKLFYVNFQQADMSNFKTENEKKYDNVICTFDSINYLLTEKKISGCFNSVYNSLTDNGLFLFDFNTLYGLLNEWNGTKLEEGRGYYIAYESTFDYDKTVLSTKMKFFIKEEDGRYLSFEEIHKEKGYTKQYIKMKLEQAGFKVLKIVPFLKKKGSSKTEFDRYQVVARKQVISKIANHLTVIK